MVSTIFSGVATALANHTSGGDLLPDLNTLPPRDLHITWENGKKLLRFSNETANRHTGPLHIYPENIDTGDCNGDGSASNDRVVYQRIYQDANNDGVFTRGTDTGRRSRVAGCMYFHPAHNHWHFDNFSKYELRDLLGILMVSGSKNSWCVEDTYISANLPGTPSSEYYGGCDQLSRQGISVGWSDVYRYHLPEQYVVITNVPDGEYCLVSTADSDNKLLETNESNNIASIRVRLSGNTVTRTSSEPCHSSVGGTTLTFTPTEDAYINSSFPGSTFGTASTLEVDSSPEVKHFLLKFNISGISGKQVLSAKIRLFAVNGSDRGGDFYRTQNTSWSEATVTWNNAPGADATRVASLGSVSAGNWYAVDVTSLVSGDGVLSLRVISPSTTTNGADYSSKEGTQRPVLVVLAGN